MMENIHEYVMVFRHVFWAALILLACIYSLKMLIQKKQALIDKFSIVAFCAVNISKKIHVAVLKYEFLFQGLDGFTYYEKTYRALQIWDSLILVLFVVLLLRVAYKDSSRSIS